MVTANKEEISKNVESFFEAYFKKYLEIIESNNYKIKNLEQISYPEIDFVFIFKFVRAELDHLKNLDSSIFDKELQDLLKSAMSAVSALASFKKGYTSAKVIFMNNFLKFNSEASTVNAKFEKAKTEKSINSMKAERITKEINDLKKLKNDDEENIQLQKNMNHELADTLQNIQNARVKLETATAEKKDFEDKYLSIFIDIYKKISDQVVHKIIKQVAIFSFSADRDIWRNATRSKKVMDFFSNINETSDMNIQRYMEYHLKYQTSSASKDENSIKFRKKLIASIEKVKLFNLKQKI